MPTTKSRSVQFLKKIYREIASNKKESATNRFRAGDRLAAMDKIYHVELYDPQGFNRAVPRTISSPISPDSTTPSDEFLKTVEGNRRAYEEKMKGGEANHDSTSDTGNG